MYDDWDVGAVSRSEKKEDGTEVGTNGSGVEMGTAELREGEEVVEGVVEGE
jgi:hypothetical protein